MMGAADAGLASRNHDRILNIYDMIRLKNEDFDNEDRCHELRFLNNFFGEKDRAN
jgi:hypothetical protein